MENEMNFEEELPAEETPAEEVLSPEEPPAEEVLSPEEPPAEGFFFTEELPEEETPAAAPAAFCGDVMPMKMPKKKRPGLRLALIALICAFLGSILGAGGVLTAQYFLNQEKVKLEEPMQPGQETPTDNNGTTIVQGQRQDVTIDITKIDTSKAMTPAEVYAKNVNSTVGITTTITTNYWGQQSTAAASGSGFILSADGYILTNHHVIEDATSITVSLFSGESYAARLIGYDESKDIAVLKVEATGLTPVVLGNSDNLNVGDSVVAIGNPLGELTFSLTTGVISAKDRQVTLSSSVTMKLLQTDCAINSGNSGGPLFNLYGEVIGVTNAKYSGSSSSGASIDNIGFAIPMNSIWEIVESIIEKGYVSKPYIGVGIADVSEEAQKFGIPAGVAVQSVTKDAPAEKAGLKKNDVITAIDGKAMNSSEMVAYVGEKEIGSTVTLTVYRQGTTLTITVTVGEQIQSYQESQQK